MSGHCFNIMTYHSFLLPLYRETATIYEALEAGAIPIIDQTPWAGLQSLPLFLSVVFSWSMTNVKPVALLSLSQPAPLN